MATAEPVDSVRRTTDLTFDFLGYLGLERGLSRNTLEAYRSDLEQFADYLGRHGLDPLEVTTNDLDGFVSELAAGGSGRPAAAPATLQRKIACLRSFYRHLHRERVIDRDPACELRAARARVRLPKVLSRDEVTRLLEQPRGVSPGALRDRALLETMYACGLRASEAIGLELSQVDLEDGTLRAGGRGSKERIVPIGGNALEALGEYLERGRPALVGVRRIELPTGGWSTPAHEHGREEERPVRRGHVVARPAGTGVAHAFRAGDAGLTYLAYGTRDPADVCYYPRSNKVAFRGIGVIARTERLDYWDGED